MQKLGLAGLALVALTCPSLADWSYDRTRPAALLKDAQSDSPVIRITCAGKGQARMQMAYPDDPETHRGKLKLILAVQQQQVTIEGQAKRVVFEDEDRGRRALWNLVGLYGFKSPIMDFLRAGGVAQVAAPGGTSEGYDVPLRGAADALDRLQGACREAALKAERLAAARNRPPAAGAEAAPAPRTAAALPPAPPSRPAPPAPAAEQAAEPLPGASPLQDPQAAEAAPPAPVQDPIATASIAPAPEAAAALGSLEYPCFPDACYGDTLLGTEVIGSDPDGTLVRARLKGWMKVGDGDRKPTPEMNTYVYCSKTHPAVMTDTGSGFSPQLLSPGERSHYDDPSAAVDLYLFFAACHGEFKPSYARAEELGYGDLHQESQEKRLARPEDFLDTNRRS